MARRDRSRTALRRTPHAVLVLGAWLWVTPALVSAQAPMPAATVPEPAPAPVVSAPDVTPPVSAAPAVVSAPGSVPGTPTVGVAIAAPNAVPVLPQEVQVVRFQAPVGTVIEVLGPETTPIAAPETPGGITVGLKVGVGYRLKVSNYPTRPSEVMYPVVEVVGHLHRPANIDPAKYPIRVIFHEDDVEDVVARGRLVTQVVYLEDPDQALPLHLPKDEIPTATLSPAEEPLKVAAALGRVMAIVRLGGRTPTPEELAGPAFFDIPGVPCPFVGPTGSRCLMPCGVVEGTAPPAGRPWVPKDEYLCDGGDGDVPTHFGGDGNLRGIDPRDAVVRFTADRRPRVLPTNLVCIYAPRFAMVRTSLGPNENKTVQFLRGAEIVQRQAEHDLTQGPKRMTQNQSPELNRHRARASGMLGRQYVGSHIEVRVLAEKESITHAAGHQLVRAVETARQRQKAMKSTIRQKAQVVKTAESAVVTGIVQGAGETAMAWKPQEIAGVEVPPNKPGLAVIKRVSAEEAEPGDVITYVIQYRNMGNVPIREVTVVDSLLPRLEYVARSAKGPEGSVFTAAENRAGAMVLRWDIGTLAPGAEGYVSFEAKVR